MTESELNQLICQIYDSAENTALLMPALKTIEKKLGVLSAHYIRYQNSDRTILEMLASKDFYEQVNHEYTEHYHSINPNWVPLTSGQQGEWLVDYQFHSEKFKSHSEYYNDFIFKNDFEHTLVSRINSSSNFSELVCFLSARSAEHFSPQQIALLERLTPHLTQAAKLREQLNELAQYNQQQDDMLSHLPYGTIWVNAQGRVISANDIAESLFHEHDGLTIKDSRLVATTPSNQEQLCQAIKLATSEVQRQGQWVTIQRQRKALPLSLSIIPTTYAAHDLAHFDDRLAMIIVSDPEHKVIPQSAHIQHLFGLTNKEACLAAALLNNETLEEFAQRHDVSYNTVRTHMNNILHKTGTKRQPELVRSLLLITPHIKP